MDQKVISIAEKIIQIDLLRDELYEELMAIAGNKALEVLRTVQNR